MSQHFQMIPAVDMLGGKIVRLFRGEYDKSTVYEVTPQEMISRFAEDGAELVHIVDLDAARSGERGANDALISELLSAAETNRVRLEIGGGIRKSDDFKKCMEQGFSRGIIGTAAVENRTMVQGLLDEFGPERVIVGVDAKGGMVRVSGWEKNSGVRALDFLRELENMGLSEVIFTDIDTDGAMTGPALNSLREVLDGTKELNVIASGGISSLEDVAALLDLGFERLSGAISGRAIYEKKLDLKEAVSLCRRRSGGSNSGK